MSTSPESEFDLVEYARTNAINAKEIPSYEKLKREVEPEFRTFLSGLRGRLQADEAAGKKILVVLGTGGTFQSKKGPDGYEPTGKLRESFDALQLPKDNTLHLELCDLMNLDSSQMTVEQWRFLAEMIMLLEEEAGDLFEGIIITHGTDTMAKGASYLSFMLKGFPKSIIFTGSQHPAREEGSDAKDQMERAIITARIASLANRRIAEVMVACGPKVTRATWAAKQGDTTTHAFGPWNDPHQAFDATDWEKAVRDGTLFRLAPPLLDFGLGKNVGSLEFAGHAREYGKKGPYEPFTAIERPADLFSVRLTDKSPEAFARHLIAQRVGLLTQLGAATADNALVDVALAAADRGKLIVVQAPFPDSQVPVGTYAAGKAIGRTLGGDIHRSLPIINTSPDAYDAKVNYALSRLGIQPTMETRGLGLVYSAADVRKFYSVLEQSLVGELV